MLHDSSSQNSASLFWSPDIKAKSKTKPLPMWPSHVWHSVKMELVPGNSGHSSLREEKLTYRGQGQNYSYLNWKSQLRLPLKNTNYWQWLLEQSYGFCDIIATALNFLLPERLWKLWRSFLPSVSILSSYNKNKTKQKKQLVPGHMCIGEGYTPGPHFSLMYLPVNMPQESHLRSSNSHSPSRYLFYFLCTFWLFFWSSPAQKEK